jgi:hypothetical protein
MNNFPIKFTKLNKYDYEDFDFTGLSESKWQHRLDGGRVQEGCRGSRS